MPSILQPRFSAVTFASKARIWQSMSNWRTLCPLLRLGLRRRAVNDYHFNSRLVRLPPTCRQYASVHASELSFGQPLHETHPHLLRAGELTPGITAIEYAERRTKLAARLPDKAIAIVAASDVKYRSGNVFYKFHQDPDFFYLTGFLEPEALAIIGKSEDGTDHTFHLYVREKDSKAEIWDGARSGSQAATDVFNADETGDISKLKSILPPIIAEASQVYSDITKPDANTSTISRFLYGSSQKADGFSGMIEAKKIRSLRPIMNDLRAYKSAAEIANMRRAGQASGRAHTEVMKHNWSHEKDLDGFLEYQFRKNGCDSIAFEPVVAGAENALSIHYVRNDDVLHDGQMVLVDGGGTYGGYIADITRCWPVNGKFSDPQRDLYEAVLKVQRSCIALCRESANMSLDKLHEIAENGLKDQLEQIGFDMAGKAIETLFPHHLGHYIGLDVHDSVGYSRKVVLSDGHCITIEPGVYIPVDDRWPRHFQGIGIRIEDSVCVQADHPYVLTTEAVKEVVDIENLRD